MVKGVNCKFDFYVIGLDTQRKYNEKMHDKGLELNEAIAVMESQVKKYPKATIALGVNYNTERKDLNSMGVGGCDLVQYVDGMFKVSDDCKKSEVLSTEGLIVNNTMKILSRITEKWNCEGKAVAL